MKKNIFLIAATIFTSIAFTLTSFAWPQWRQDDKGWWVEYENGTYAADEWVWKDGNGDWLLECYYFGEDGYTKPNSTIWGIYQTDSTGAWTVNGKLQQQIPMDDDLSKINNKKLSEEQKQKFGYDNVIDENIEIYDNRSLIDPIPVKIYYNNTYRNTNEKHEKEYQNTFNISSITKEDGRIYLIANTEEKTWIEMDGLKVYYYPDGTMKKEECFIGGPGPKTELFFSPVYTTEKQRPDRIELFINNNSN